MSKRHWISIDQGSSMDQAISEAFLSSHECGMTDRGYLSNALVGQHTGLVHRFRPGTVEVIFECLGCRKRHRVEIPAIEFDRFARFPDWAMQSIRETMDAIGCDHQQGWMLSPLLMNDDGDRYRLIHCRTCHKRARMDW